MRREATGCTCPPGLPQCVCHHQPRLKLAHKGVIAPSLAEEKANPRSRSAKMRVAGRIIDNEEFREDSERLIVLTAGKTSGWKRPEMLNMIYGAAQNFN